MKGIQLLSSAWGYRELRERNDICRAKGIGVLSLFSCKRTCSLKEKVSFNRAGTHSSGDDGSLGAVAMDRVLEIIVVTLLPVRRGNRISADQPTKDRPLSGPTLQIQ